MVGTYRPEETGWSHPLTRLRQGLGRDHRVMRLTVKALSDDAVRRLAQSLVGEQDGKKLGALLYRESQGNAFFLTETLSALEEEGALMPCSTSLSHNGNHEGRWIWSGEGASDTLPLSVQDVILQRVGRLSECAQRLLTLAAVTSQQFDVALLKSASGLDEDLIETSLEEWLTRYLVLSQSPAS
jgi:predicted ATPase